MTLRRPDHISTESCSYATFSPSIGAIKSIFFHPLIQNLIRYRLNISMIMNWVSKGVVKYAFMMTMGCAALKPFLQILCFCKRGSSSTHGLWHSMSSASEPSICMDYLLWILRALVGLGMLDPTPVIGDAGVLLYVS